MQSFLLATGEVEKLRPLTNSTPSPMCPVLNRPVMTYGVELLARHGAKEIFVALLQQGATIEEHFGDGKRWDVHFHYLLQRQAVGTAGALKRAEQLINETVLVLPADVLFDLDIEAAVADHRAHGAVATVICNRGGPTGAYIFEPEVLALIPVGEAHDCEDQLIPALLAAGYSVHQHASGGYWNPLHTFTDLHNAQRDMFASLIGTPLPGQQPPLRYPVGEGHEIAPGIWTGTHTIIHPTAKLTPPLYIGSDCRVGAQVELGPQSFLGKQTIIDQGATIQQSTILPHTYIGEMVDVQGRIVAQNLLIDQATATAVAIPDRFLLGKVSPRLPAMLLRTVLERGFALILLLLLLPLLVLLGLLLWSTSGTAPLSANSRIGTRPAALLQGKREPALLRLLQLRTRDNAHAHLPLGEWLEQWELHRLPELWSVVRGEIALVGVKPLTATAADAITEEWQKVRYQSPAGFTGLWYVQQEHDRGAEESWVADSYYAATETTQQAVRLLWQTPQVWARSNWQGRNQQQPNEQQLAQSSEVRSQPAVQ